MNDERSKEYERIQGMLAVYASQIKELTSENGSINVDRNKKTKEINSLKKQVETQQSLQNSSNSTIKEIKEQMANLTTKLKKIYSQNVKNIEVFSQKALDELKDFEKKVDDLENRLKVSEEKLLDSEAVRNELK